MYLPHYRKGDKMPMAKRNVEMMMTPSQPMKTFQMLPWETWIHLTILETKREAMASTHPFSLSYTIFTIINSFRIRLFLRTQKQAPYRRRNQHCSLIQCKFEIAS
ncbi:hypothetical protein PoB_004859100 [Plakobranchus ocellatus]|uniref:Uncharacterized protein n=1 Tax=Plakobranchus ocellatus TaxID=259542 RepID=A0AAV4BNP3_9GAST|nr:hypothetical protein PoB_004859100 [Plakobranchus ocellatus]